MLAEKNTAVPKNVSPVKLEMMITIVDKVKAEYYADLIESYDVNFQFIMIGHGTAKAEILDVLGLSETEKAVIFSVVRADKTEELLYTLGTKFRPLQKGKGIAVTVPFTSMIGTSVYAFLCNAKETL